MKTLWLLIAWIPCVAIDEGELLLSNNQTMRGRIERITDRQLTLVTAESTLQLPFEQLASYSRDIVPRENAGSIVVQWSDESTLTCTSISLADGVLQLGLSSGEAGVAQQIAADPRRVAAVILKPEQIETLADDWQAIRSKAQPLLDSLVIARDQRLQSVEGLVRRIDDKTLEFVMDEEKVAIPLERLTALVLRGERNSAAVPNVILSAGNAGKLHCESIESVDGAVSARLICGEHVQLPDDWWHQIDFAPGRTTWLSELKPLEIEWQPIVAGQVELAALQRLNRPRFEQSFNGEPLRLRATESTGAKSTQVVQHGIAIRGGTRLVYSLSGEFRRLWGRVGFAPEAHDAGHCQLIIRADGQDLWQKELVCEDNATESFDVDVSSVSRLEIRVEYLDGRSVGDELHLCDLMLER